MTIVSTARFERELWVSEVSLLLLQTRLVLWQDSTHFEHPPFFQLPHRTPSFWQEDTFLTLFPDSTESDLTASCKSWFLVLSLFLSFFLLSSLPFFPVSFLLAFLFLFFICSFPLSSSPSFLSLSFFLSFLFFLGSPFVSYILYILLIYSLLDYETLQCNSEVQEKWWNRTKYSLSWFIKSSHFATFASALHSNLCPKDVLGRIDSNRGTVLMSETGGSGEVVGWGPKFGDLATNFLWEIDNIQNILEPGFCPSYMLHLLFRCNNQMLLSLQLRLRHCDTSSLSLVWTTNLLQAPGGYTSHIIPAFVFHSAKSRLEHVGSLFRSIKLYRSYEYGMCSSFVLL